METETLDHFVSADALGRVDFIKMDIEGSEPEALVGAEQTIRKHRPQLAISIYHDLRHTVIYCSRFDVLRSDACDERKGAQQNHTAEGQIHTLSTRGPAPWFPE